MSGPVPEPRDSAWPDEKVRLEAELARARARLEDWEAFGYVVSHDLREPLRGVLSFGRKLAQTYRGQLDPPAQDWIDRLLKGAERLRQLIEATSTYSRVLHRSASPPAAVDCTTAVAEARANLQAALEEGGAELVVGPLPAVPGNRQHLLLLFQHLIGNAVKFRAPDRPARVEVAARREGDGWLFEVRDNGIGIEAKYLERIFGLGERLHPASKYPGTGFGLAVCAKVVAGHGGRIWAESRPGQGSSFLFTLPDTPPAAAG